MNPFDALLLLLLLVGLVAGARAGFFGPVIGLVGAVAAFGLALGLASLFRDQLAVVEQPTRAIVTLIGLAAFVVIGEAIGSLVGGRLSHGARLAGLRTLDAFGGAVVGAAHVVLLGWLLGGMIGAGMAPGLGAAGRDSVALRILNAALPPPVMVAGRLMALLDTTDLPPLFAGLEPAPAPPVDLPTDPEVQALTDSAAASTAKVSSTGCGGAISVGSGFFVSGEHLVTNAHVVAGGSGTAVTVGSAVFTASVVAFDPDADLALLHVPGAGARALTLLTEPPSRGSTGVALGYPGGGDLTVEPAAVTATFDIAGPGIYGDGESQHSVVEMRTRIRQGNSGGPLVVEPGVVGGVVFGGSRTAADVGYAIGTDQAMASIGPFIGSTAPVGTGACL